MEGRRLVPAGQAIVVVLLAMLLAALLNADSLVQTIEGQSFGTARDTGLALAHPVRTVSHWTGLNLPRKLIDNLVNGHPGAPVAVSPAGPSPTTTSGPVAEPTTTTSTTLPPRRAPTAQAPLKVWLAGDSLMGTLAESFIDKVSGNPLVKATADFRVATGLARPDRYDWPAAIARQMTSQNPDVVILVFGTNDDQDILAGGHRFSLQSEDWQQEYARRVNQVLDATANGVRQVIWLGIPAVRRPRLNQTKDLINTIVKAAVAQRRSASYIDTGGVLDGAGGSFATYLTNSGGQAVTIRESDGIHITLAGAGLVTPALLADIDHLWSLTLA